MKAEITENSRRGTFSTVLALVAAVFVFVVLTNTIVPLVSNTGAALVALVVLGFVMCTAGGLSGKVDRDGFSWLSPFVILGMLLGLTAIYVTFAGLTGRSLPFVTGERGAFILLAGIIVVKWALSRIHAFLIG